MVFQVCIHAKLKGTHAIYNVISNVWCQGVYAWERLKGAGNAHGAYVFLWHIMVFNACMISSYEHCAWIGAMRCISTCSYELAKHYTHACWMQSYSCQNKQWVTTRWQAWLGNEPQHWIACMATSREQARSPCQYCSTKQVLLCQVTQWSVAQ